MWAGNLRGFEVFRALFLTRSSEYAVSPDPPLHVRILAIRAD